MTRSNTPRIIIMIHWKQAISGQQTIPWLGDLCQYLDSPYLCQCPAARNVLALKSSVALPPISTFTAYTRPTTVAVNIVTGPRKQFTVSPRARVHGVSPKMICPQSPEAPMRSSKRCLRQQTGGAVEVGSLSGYVRFFRTKTEFFPGRFWWLRVSRAGAPRINDGALIPPKQFV
ncbi:hypothetical protein BDR05DRAFT_300672 [Suillus weaverae]|nr:hypothetical protein BDR05DRAFT_300672 [Suillus weaverae]